MSLIKKKKETTPTSSVPPAGAGKLSKKPSNAEKPPPDLTAKDLVAQGVDPKVARDWLRIRKAKKAPLTETAWDGIKREAAAAGMAPAQAVKRAAESSWGGFKASWVAKGGAAAPAGDWWAGNK